MIIIKVKIDDINVNYIRKGTGKAVLIIPGWGTNISIYNTMISELEKYRDVITLDMPGTGDTPEPKNSWDVHDYVDFIIKFIKSQKIESLDLIGHSNGGRIIIDMLSKKDLPFNVGKVILIGSAGIVHKKTVSQKTRVRFFKIAKSILKVISPSSLEKLKEKMGSPDYKSATPIMRQTLVKLVNEDLTNKLSSIKNPVLLIWGELDDQTPIEDAILMEKMIKDAGLVRVPGCSHYVFLENPILVNRVIKVFLEGEN